MEFREVKYTRDSMQSVEYETPSRATSTWNIFPLAPRRSLGDRTGGDDHVNGNAIKVESSEEFLGRVSHA